MSVSCCKDAVEINIWERVVTSTFLHGSWMDYYLFTIYTGECCFLCIINTGFNFHAIICKMQLLVSLGILRLKRGLPLIGKTGHSWGPPALYSWPCKLDLTLLRKAICISGITSLQDVDSAEKLWGCLQKWSLLVVQASCTTFPFPFFVLLLCLWYNPVVVPNHFLEDTVLSPFPAPTAPASSAARLLHDPLTHLSPLAPSRLQRPTQESTAYSE